MIRSFLPHMEEAGEGIIANFSPIGDNRPLQKCAYSQQWAVEGLTRSLAQELQIAVAFNRSNRYPNASLNLWRCGRLV